MVLKYQKIITWIRELLRDSKINNWKIGPYAIINLISAAVLLYGSGLAITDNVLFLFI